MGRTSAKKIGLSPEILSGYKLQVCDINEKFLQLVWNTIEEQGNKIAALLIDNIIGTAQKYKKETIFSADGTGLENLWVDYYTQKQSEDVGDIEKMEEILSGICFNEIIDLKTQNNDQHKILTLYLSQSGYNYDECLLDDTGLEAFFLSEIQSAALSFTNKPIVEYIDK